MTESDPEIDALYAAWGQAFRRGDVDAILSLVTSDYVHWAPGAAPIHRDALRPQLEAAIASYEIESRFECVERLVSGDLAVDLGWDIQVVRPRGAGAAKEGRHRVVLVLQRGSDKVWRFARGMSQPGPAA